jgi:hypothetical protein
VSHTRRVQIGVAVLVIVIYWGGLLRNLNESKRRSLQLRELPVGGDHAGISLRVVAVDLATSEITARMNFRLDGKLAKDPVTPAVDLTLFLNGIRGPQEIDFPRGKRISPIEVAFPMDGNVNQYPFDRYDASILMMVTRKVPNSPPSRQRTRKASKKAGPTAGADAGLLVAATQESEPLPIASSITASIPGLKFEGQREERPAERMEGFKLVIQRADNVIVVSIFVMVLMMSLAMSVLLMSFQALSSDKKIELLPLSLSVTLLFGLPALRNAQPAVPSLGVFGDYLSFIWAEQIVAVSAVILIWTWVIRQRRAKPEG